MARAHFYVMGVIALLFGVLSMAEYVLVSYGLSAGWLEAYAPEQVAWLRALPGWVHGLWGAYATLALVGALCLLAHVRSAVWMLGLSFVALVVLYGWLILGAGALATVASGGWHVWGALVAALALSFLIYLYARQEKLRGEVL
jgi:hypothetical protein